MSVPLTQIRLFLETLLPEQAKIGVDDVFKSYEAQGFPTVCQGINAIQPFIHNDDVEVSAAAINGILVGLLLAKSSETPEIQKIIDGWLEQYKRTKGEHVIDFTQFKIKRGR